MISQATPTYGRSLTFLFTSPLLREVAAHAAGEGYFKTVFTKPSRLSGIMLFHKTRYVQVFLGITQLKLKLLSI